MRFLFSFILILTINSASAQNGLVYNIGFLGNTNSLVNIYSGPIVFDNGYCLKFKNGVNTLQPKKFGVFKDYCSISYGNYYFIVYPNPVITDATIKSIVKIYTSSDQVFYVNVYNVLGMLFLSKKVSGMDLFIGSKLELSRIASGVYIVQVCNQDKAVLNSFKIIKEN